jgi:hypothetical protein
MSLSALADRANSRRSDTGPEIREAEPVAPSQGAKDVSKATSSIASFIPSEVITVYVGAATLAASDSASRTGGWVALWCVLLATPLVSWLLYASAVRAEGKPLPLKPRSWPWFEGTTATAGFFLWAGMLPNSPMNEWHWYSNHLFAFLTLVYTVALGLISPLFAARPINIIPAA